MRYQRRDEMHGCFGMIFGGVPGVVLACVRWTDGRGVGPVRSWGLDEWAAIAAVAVVVVAAVCFAVLAFVDSAKQNEGEKDGGDDERFKPPALRRGNGGA